MFEPKNHKIDGSVLDKLISSRRSIRKYKSDIPPEGDIHELIRCASWAPSPSNSQPVRFFRVSSLKIRERLRQSMEDGRRHYLEAVEQKHGPKRLKNWVNVYWRYSIFMFDAPVLMAVGTLERVAGFSWRLFEAGYNHRLNQMHNDLVLATGMAAKGLFLKATELGLGTCMLTAPLSFLSEPEKILGVKDVRILGFITIGYPDEEPFVPDRNDVSAYYQEL